MSTLFHVLSAIKAFYTYPVQIWQKGFPDCYTFTYQVGHRHLHTEHHCFPSSPDHGSGAFYGLMIYGWTVIIIALLIRFGLALRDLRVYRRNVRPCQHCEVATLDKSDGSHEDCEAGEACCLNCEYNHRYQEYPDKDCSSDGIEMLVVSFRGDFFYWCPACGDITMSQAASLILELRLDEEGVDLGLFAAIAATTSAQNAYSES